MRVGINIVYWRPKGTGGLETMLRGLLPAMAQVLEEVPSLEIFLLGTTDNLAALGNVSPKLQRVSVCHGWNGTAARLWHEHVGVRRTARRLSLDLVHTMNYFGPLSLPCRSIVSVLDMNYRAVPETFTRSTRLARATFTVLSCARASGLITLSEFSKTEIERYLAPTAPIFPVHLAPSADLLHAQPAWPEDLPSDRPYLLSVGTLFPHKNFQGLVRAYDHYSDELRSRNVVPAALYMAGLERGGAPAVWDAIARSRNVESIRLLGPMPDANLKALYQRALGFVFPSLYEGFGIPPLEAMALRCPVVCSNAASLPEVVGDGALLVNARDHEQLGEALCKLHVDEIRRNLIAKGSAHVAHFSWMSAARRVLEAYVAVAADLPRAVEVPRSCIATA